LGYYGKVRLLHQYSFDDLGLELVSNQGLVLISSTPMATQELALRKIWLAKPVNAQLALKNLHS